MLKRRRSLMAAACVPLIAAIAAGAALAQETNTVGPPQLKDFQLPGQRTTPPVATPPAQPEPRAAIPAPAPATPRPAPAATASKPRRTAETPRTAGSAPPRTAPSTVQVPAAALPAPAPAPVSPIENTVSTAPAPSQPVPPPMAAAPPPASRPAPSTPFNWLWLLLPALLLVAAGLAWRLLRRRAAVTDVEDRASLAGSLAVARWVDEEDAQPVPAPAPAPVAEVPAPEPAPAAAVPEPQPARPWLEVDIAPERAASNESEAVIQYELVIRNTGAAPARNIRIDARLFNASADASIAAFLTGPIHEQSGSPHVAIAPGGDLRLASAVAMKQEDVRAIELEGRRIFVPSLAVNVAYDWDGATIGGRTSRSWLLGRESDASPKMGPFRLDLGPRVYRQVGRRETKSAMV